MFAGERMKVERSPSRCRAMDEGASGPEAPAALNSARYRSSAPPRWVAFLITAALHIVGFYVLATFNVTVLRNHAEALLVVNLVPLPSRAPAPPLRKKEVATRVPMATAERITAPSPMVTIAPELPTVAVPQNPPASQSAIEGPPERAQSEPIAVDSLAAKLISAAPPRYPIESRRKREMGTVILSVTVGEDGRVETISVHQSSGFERLDRAALGAVRQWRWLSTTIDGQAVRVRGLVRIPFELRT